MKKIAVLLLLVLVCAGCAIYRTTNVSISNNSDYIAYVRVSDFKKDGDHKGVEYIKLSPHTGTFCKLYDNGTVTLTRPNRNYLKKSSDKSYEVINSPKRIIKVFNKTGEKITLSEVNNLFDKITMLPNEVKDIDVFTLNDFYPYAISEQGIILKTSLQGGLVITF